MKNKNNFQLAESKFESDEREVELPEDAQRHGKEDNIGEDRPTVDTQNGLEVRRQLQIEIEHDGVNRGSQGGQRRISNPLKTRVDKLLLTPKDNPRSFDPVNTGEESPPSVGSPLNEDEVIQERDVISAEDIPNKYGFKVRRDSLLHGRD